MANGVESVVEIHGEFLDALNESRDLFTYCRSPVGPHTSTGVESAFLDAFKAWEVFLETLTIAYLTGEPDIEGNLALSVMKVSDTEACKKIINGGRSFVSWAKIDEVRQRFAIFFEPSTLDSLRHSLHSGAVELREMETCRNAIAHSSGSAYDKLADLWRNKSGASRSTLRCADVLLLPYEPNPPLTWFDRYMQALEVISQNLVQVGAASD